VDVALPCATPENELDGEDAKALIKQWMYFALLKGANMPSYTLKAIHEFHKAKENIVLCSRAKAIKFLPVE